MKAILPLTALLLLTGCTSPWFKGQTAQQPKPAAPVASIEVSRANKLEFFTGYEARCQIHSIDGVAVDSNFQLLPGNHTLTVSLSHLGREYTGDVDLVIPEAKAYELKAKRKGDSFTLSIVDVEQDKVIATSTAPIDDHMKFLVFVVQQ